MPSAKTPQVEQPLARWLPLAAIGVVAVLAGIVLPQLLPATGPLSFEPRSSEGGVTSPHANGRGSDVPVASSDQAAKNAWSYTPPAWPEPPNHGAVLMRLGVGTVAVLILCATTLWCCKRWLRAGVASTPSGAQLRCVETLMLGNRCVVHLVKVGNQPVLVGADAGGVKTIVPLPESFAQTLHAADEQAA